MFPKESHDDMLDKLHEKNNRDSQAAQLGPVPGYPELTARDLANALIAGSVRNGFLETLHAGSVSPLLDDPALSRITDAEMKKLMVESSAELALRLSQFFSAPEAFADWLQFIRRYTNGWERKAVTCEVPEEKASAARCPGCGAPRAAAWRFCSSCGHALDLVAG
jgi:hypothetical protein